MTPSSSDALVVVSGPMTGQTLPLERRELVVGRDPACDIALSNYTQVSRRHARLFPTPTGWNVEDLGSTNGTFINNVRVQNIELRDGARLKLGDFEATVRLPAPHPEGVPTIQPTQVVTPAPPLVPPSPSPFPAPQHAPRPAPAKSGTKVWPIVVGSLLVIVGGIRVLSFLASPATATRTTNPPATQSRPPIDTMPDAGDKRDGGTDTSDPANSGNTDTNKKNAEQRNTPANVAPPVDGKIAPATVALAKAATVLIVREEGTQLAFGSGFVTGDGHQIVTNRHVVTSGDAPSDCLIVFGAGTSDQRKISVPASNIQLANGSDQFADDLALLSLPSDINTPAPLALGRSENLSETATAWVFGFPLGVGTLTLDREIPSASVKGATIERIQRGEVDGADSAKVIQLGSTVTHGNSGGPVLNANGEVVGVISAGNDGTGISYAIPTVWVKRLMG